MKSMRPVRFQYKFLMQQEMKFCPSASAQPFAYWRGLLIFWPADSRPWAEECAWRMAKWICAWKTPVSCKFAGPGTSLQQCKNRRNQWDKHRNISTFSKRIFYGLDSRDFVCFQFRVLPKSIFICLSSTAQQNNKSIKRQAFEQENKSVRARSHKDTKMPWTVEHNIVFSSAIQFDERCDS